MIKFNWMLRNSKGEHDGSWSLAVFSWLVVCICILLSVLETVTVGGVSIAFKAPDTTLLLGFLISMTGNYTYRRTKKEASAKDAPTNP